MTASAKPVAKEVGRVRAWRPPLLQHVWVRIAVVAICLMWTIPTLGLLVTSVRNPLFIATSGWWTALFHPFDADQWTLANYQQVLNNWSDAEPVFGARRERARLRLAMLMTTH